MTPFSIYFAHNRVFLKRLIVTHCIPIYAMKYFIGGPAKPCKFIFSLYHIIVEKNAFHTPHVPAKPRIQSSSTKISF